MLTFVSAPLLRRSNSSIGGHPQQLASSPLLLRASADPLGTDWRAFRARLVRSETSTASESSSHSETAEQWAHPVPFIEKGTVLIASPEHFTPTHSCAFFANTLVYILEHNSASTTGLILNRPIARSLPVLPSHPTLNLGGPVALDTVLVLHRDAKFGQPIVGHVRAASFKEAVNRINEGAMEIEHCRFFCGYSGWAPGQLETEVKDGVWYTCAVADNVIMEGLGEGALPKVLRLMGGNFEEIARRLDERDKMNS